MGVELKAVAVVELVVAGAPASLGRVEWTASYWALCPAPPPLMPSEPCSARVTYIPVPHLWRNKISILLLCPGTAVLQMLSHSSYPRC